MEHTFKWIKKSLTSRSQRTVIGEQSASDGIFRVEALAWVLGPVLFRAPTELLKSHF